MLFLLFVLCSILPVIGHVLVGLLMNWPLVGTILGLQILACIPLIGPIIALFIFGWAWAIGLLVIQLLAASRG